MTRSLALVGIMVWMSAALADDRIYTDPDKAAADFPFQGEYVGKAKTDDGEVKLGLQVGVLGGSDYHAISYVGGLPGEGWDKKHKDEADGEIKDGVLVFDLSGTEVKIKDGVAVATNLVNPRETLRLDKVKRSSPTLGAKPPEGAVVLFDGTSADAFDGGKMTEDGLLEPGCTSKQKFGSCKLHIEFRTPLQPFNRSGGRGCSSFFVGGRYPVQILDSFGLGVVHTNQYEVCGELDNKHLPEVNMCLPPLSWQTYDIDYTAAKYNGDKLVKNPRMTILHNGVVIQKDVELNAYATIEGAPIIGIGPEPGPIYLVETGSPVRYRNIWVEEKDDKRLAAEAADAARLEAEAARKAEREERERKKRAVEDALKRTWEDSTGKFKVTARLTAVLPGPVAQLTKDDGTVIEVKLFQLKITDRKWVVESGKALLEKLKEFK